jgi:DNA topoisomerase I
MTKRLVIVESPTKARTLTRFLGDGFIVESSIGHVRDLPANASEIPAAYKGVKWARLGVDIENDFKPLYVVHADKKKKIGELKKKLKEADEVLLATDEDREGEAISWHLVEVLKPKVPTHRMVFHEITKAAILKSLEETREIDLAMVGAQEARRIIDRLYGYEVSPILWRKVAPRLSAGRVQSIAIRMIVERELARMRFKSAEYWGISVQFETPAEERFEATLQTLGGLRVAKGTDFNPDTGRLKNARTRLLGGEEAARLQEALKDGSFSIRSAEEKTFVRRPAPPFTTSTLQQEGNRKLKFDARRTMRAAQRLYENGFITYMRTDSVALSREALDLTRAAILEKYGSAYLPEQPRFYRTKVKNAQEAHEAIRPAGERVAPVAAVRSQLGPDEARIYELIWKRTMACQMNEARGRRMTLTIAGEVIEEEAVFVATGNVIDFPGFLRAYVEGSDDPQSALDRQETILPPVKEGETVKAGEIAADQRFTAPPQRLTEATLVKSLEESGIGRPSTYASIIDTIQRREYTFKKAQALVPTFTAFAVVSLMERHFSDLIDTGFTARMEDRLDAIARGEGDPLPYLKEFYYGNSVPGLRALLDQKIEDIDPREVCTIPIGEDDEGRKIVVRVGRYGPYLQREDATAPIPEGTCPDELTPTVAGEMLSAGAIAVEPIGTDPATGLPVFLKTGRFGPYVQLGEVERGSKKKPKMVSLLKDWLPETTTIEMALDLLSMPRTVGQDENGVDVVVSLGRYGPYVKRGEDTRSLEPTDDPLTVGLERCLVLLATKRRGRGAGRTAAPLHVFAAVEALGGKDLKVLAGRYGPYVSDGTVNASLPKGAPEPEKLTLEEALDILEKKRAKGPGRKPVKKKAAAKKKAPAKKKAAAKKKAPAKKKDEA